jgi:hypothetical protein
MTNAYQIAQNLGLVGTDQEIVDQLKATGITATRIHLADLLFLLNNRGMLVRLIRPVDTGEKWAGTVVNMVLALNASGTPEQAAAVNQWFSHITNDRNQFFDTTVAAFSAPFWALSQSMAGLPGMPSAEDFAAVAALGGGWLFASLTVQQYLSDKAEHDAQVAANVIAIQRNDWKERFDAALNTIGTSEQAAGVAAIRAIADEMEAAQL